MLNFCINLIYFLINTVKQNFIWLNFNVYIINCEIFSYFKKINTAFFITYQNYFSKYIHLNYLNFKLFFYNKINSIWIIENCTDSNPNTLKLNHILYYISNINLTYVVIICVFIKIINLINSNTRYNSTKAIILTITATYLILNEFNLTFWLFFITLAELTSMYLVSLILINNTNLKIKKKNINWFYLIIVLITSNSYVNYTWFDFITNINQQTQILTVLKNTIYNQYNITIIILIIWILTVLLLASVVINVNKQHNINIIDFVTKTKIIINTTNESLNLFLKDFLTKWKNK